MEGGWEKARGSVSVVGQDKGNGPVWPVGPRFRWFSHDFFTVHTGASRSRPARVRRSLAALAGMLVLMADLIAIGWIFQLRILLTDSSAPAGIYHLVAVPPAHGELVLACLPPPVARTGLTRGYLQRGDCLAGAEPVAKVIGAMPGDSVELEPRWVAINGSKFPNSQTALRDSAGRTLAHVLSGAHRVGAGEVWLFGFHNVRSWDARYFGPVPLANVRGMLRPLVTW
jgi:conjugative transfer signal peptidase TraF